MMNRALILTAFAMAAALSGLPARADVDAALQRARSAAAAPLRIRRAGRDGLVNFLTSGSGGGIPLPAARGAAAAERARLFLQAHGALFGLAGADEVAVQTASGLDATGMEHMRLGQQWRGVPVAGAGLTLHLRGAAVVSVLARTVADASATSLVASLDAAAATARAGELLAALEVDRATLDTPRLELFNRGLFDHSDAPTRLAWYVEASATARREAIWIDAQSGAVLLHFNQVADALNRQIYDAMNTAALPGTLARLEGSGPTGNVPVDSAYDFTGGTYSYYLTEHGRDSFDGAGATMLATVNSTTCGSPCFNAFWNGVQTVFGLNFAVDDLVGHEWTHGVTQYEANLIYFMESGAMNESFSDIFGETIDLQNGVGSDDPGNRWWIGEDILPGMLAGIRYMYDPVIANDPGKMSDSQFVCNDGSVDGGGVHSNSGVGNHAYALMVDGGTYNGFTVTGIGLTKAAKIEYRALTQYLVPASTYADDYDALNQSCLDLIGTAGITAADCVEVQKALDAIEMSSPWPCSSGTPTPTPTSTPTPTPTPACGAAPRGGCLSAPKALVVLKHDPAAPTRDMLLWKWINGTTPPTFGNPTTATGYTFCLYDGASPLPLLALDAAAGGICGSAPCWESTGSGSYKYHSDLSADGVTDLIKVKPGSGNAKIQLKARGDGVGLPPLPFTSPLTIQLLKSDGPECWESVFDAPAVKSTGKFFKDKLP